MDDDALALDDGDGLSAAGLDVGAERRRGARWIDVQVDGSRVSAEQAAAVNVQDREARVGAGVRAPAARVDGARSPPQEFFTREMFVAVVCALKLLQRYEPAQ